MADFGYTVGSGATADAWYIRMPWHLRGTVAEVISQFEPVNDRLPGCVGVEYWDGHVQIERHKFPWC
jgi:hypothetical protein